MDDLIFLEYRCTCNHLLFKGIISPGSNLQVKCKNCSKVVSCGSSIGYEEGAGNRFIFLLGDKAQILDASTSSSRVLGYSLEEIKQMTVFDFVSHVNLSDWYRLMGILDNMPNKFFVSDTNFTTKSGDKVRLRTKFKKHDLVKGPAVVVFYELIGGNDKAIKETSFKSPRTSLLNLIMEVGIDGTIVYINDELLNKFNLEKKVDVLGKKIFDFFYGESEGWLESDFKSLSLFQKTVIFHDIGLNGVERKFDLLFTPAYYPDNRIKGFKVIVKDHF